jgi:hypothetical protein
MRYISSAIILILLFAGCSTEYAEETEPLNEADSPALAIGRDMLAAALLFDINRFVEQHQPEIKVCFLSILDSDPADELLVRLEGARLEVHKFSEWTTYFRNEDGQPVMPDRYFRISVRDVRIIDSTHAEVDLNWNVSGLAAPSETFFMELIEGAWIVTDVRFTS